ncbi:MAG: 1-acyl-sn-glycerol-3-phosphate acyltransferase [Desulfobacteraceae bacterium]|nr:MAG: 1-acyl-sn-glycerol-3-phosphate acyltransferase [Desulfobacteraceae bacterium]
MIILRSLVLWIVGSVWFLFSFFILVFCLVLFSREFSYQVCRRLFRFLVALMGIRLRIEGAQHMDKQRTYIIMGNHQSLFDIFIIPCAIPYSFVGIEAAYHFRFPLWGYLIKKWGNIPIEREDRSSAIQSLKQAAGIVKQGRSIGVLPEGHRTRTGRLGSFKKGPFYLAKEAGADILPFGIHGLYEYQKRGAFRIYPGNVRIRVGPPIPFREIEHLPVNEMSELLRQRIQELIDP